MSRVDAPLFYQSLLLFGDKEMERLSGATVAVAGIGGIGAIATEMLGRMGVGHVRLSDPDVYKEYNLNRQLFATTETIGRGKAVVAAERLRSINPHIDVNVCDQGILLANVQQFCEGADVIVAQPDLEWAKVLLHRVAKERRIPIVCGSRSSIHDHRWKVRARIWNYRDRPETPCYDETYHPQLAGVPFEAFTQEMLEDYHRSYIDSKDMGVFRGIAEEKPHFYGPISKEDLLHRIATQGDFHNRHVCGVIANTAGCLAAMAAVRLLLGGPEGALEINLWDGDSSEAGS